MASLMCWKTWKSTKTAVRVFLASFFDVLGESGYLLNIFGLKEPGQPLVNHSFHKFGQNACDGDRPIVVKVYWYFYGTFPLVRYETGFPDFAGKRQHGFLGFWSHSRMNSVFARRPFVI
ncbi:unnamed protein product [Rodentolepis nana]|uniref:Secreted protein n=1 Tax=Rodentolepis nana TaxID=102285 RepID=A0A0R3TNA4_RODNA|nr:unnamed protein product [Rodentolepis nana]